ALPTYHPAFLFHGAMHLRPVVVFDLIKAEREAKYPEIRRPPRFIYIPETIDDVLYCLREIEPARRLSIDIETAADQITCIGFAWAKDHALVVPIFDNRKANRSYWSLEDEQEIWRLVCYMCQLPMSKVYQNSLYVIRFK